MPAVAKRAQVVTLDLPRLRPDQWAIVNDPAKIKVLSMGRRWGKSVMLGAVSTSAAAAGAKVGLGAPNYRNTRPLWRWAESAVRPLVAAKLAIVNRAERVIEFPQSDGFLGFYTMDNADAIRGERFHLFGIDEAARVPLEAWEEVVLPTLADFDGQAFLISTPKGRNWFWQYWKQGQEDGSYIKSWKAPTSDNPIPQIRRAFERARERVPELTFQQEWLAEFVEDSMVYFSPDWWDGQNRYDPTAFRHANTCIARYMSWDTGFKDTEGNAYSACIVADLMPDYRLQIREVYRERLNFPGLIQKMAQIGHEYGEDGKLRSILIEDRASGTSAYQTIVASGDRLLAHVVRPFMPRGSKDQRAAQAGVWCQNGSVLLPYPGETVRWLSDFEEELYAIPNAPYRDQGDALAQLIIYLERILQAGLDARKAGFKNGLYRELWTPSGRVR